jgi:hypothetical protein
MSTDMLPMVWPDAPNARRTDPETSHAAADSNDTAGSRLAVRAVLEGTKKPLADFQIHQAHRLYFRNPYTESRLRTARHELAEAGEVVADGTTRTPTGRRSTTWRLA